MIIWRKILKTMENQESYPVSSIFGAVTRYYFPDFLDKGKDVILNYHVSMEYRLYYVFVASLNMIWVLSPMDEYLEENF